jgi:hypothetical protein
MLDPLVSLDLVVLLDLRGIQVLQDLLVQLGQ